MYISVRDAHLPGTFGTIKAGLAAMGLNAVELDYRRDRSVSSLDTPNASESLASRSKIAAFAYKCKGLGIKPAAFLLGNDFGADDLEAELDYVISALRAAFQLGMPAIRIDAIMQDGRDWTLEKRTQHFAECMHRILDATSRVDVAMGIENHGNLGNDPDFLEMVLDRVDSPRVGVTIDTANFYWFGHPLSKVHKIIERLAPRTKHTHVKNINYPTGKREIQREVGWEYGKYVSPLREGDIDLKRLVKTLSAAGYKGDLCIEDESLGRFDLEKQRAVLKDDAAYLKEILAGSSKAT